MKLGASFSHPHLKYLELDSKKAIEEFKTLGLTWIRLGCYWNEIEKERGLFDFSQIDPLVEYCERNKIKVCLTVGMKAPRWPEYYIPNWLLGKLDMKYGAIISKTNKILLEATLNFVDKTVQYFKCYNSIKVWQVENEPLDPSGPNWWKISPSLLKEETKHIKKITTSSITKINLWGNELSKRGYYKKAMKIVDVIGLTIFLKCPTSDNPKESIFKGPLDSQIKLRRIANEIRRNSKEFWITELQAEPWEPGEIVSDKINPPSFLLKHFEKNLNYANCLNPSVTLLWGFEYWLWRKEKFNDERYWSEAKRLITNE